MSRIWTGKDQLEATPIGGFGDFGSLARQGGGFRTLYGDEASSESGGRAWNVTHPGQPTHAPDPADAPREQPDPVEEAAREAFLQGFREGERIATEAAQADDAARVALAAAVQQLAQSGEGTLAAMLSQAVVRLVGQIMGEVAIDEAMLRERCAAVAACIEGDDSHTVLEVNPEDLPLLEMEQMGVALAANPELSRGSVRLATADGWIEDGPDVRLARLKALLDDMEGRR